jgi:hypothetical protein
MLRLVLKTKNNSKPLNQSVLNSLQIYYFHNLTIKLKLVGHPANNFESGLNNLFGGNNLSVRGIDLSIGGIDLSVRGNDLSIAGKHLPIGGNEFSISGKHLSIAGNNFTQTE